MDKITQLQLRQSYEDSGSAWAWSTDCDLINPHTIPLRAWETGLNSTEKKMISRIKKVLNTLDELNHNMVRSMFFEEINMLIKSYVERGGYVIQANGNTYSIRRKKVLKSDKERGFTTEPEFKDFTNKAKSGISKFGKLNSSEMERLRHEFDSLFDAKIGTHKIGFYEWIDSEVE